MLSSLALFIVPLLRKGGNDESALQQDEVLSWMNFALSADRAARIIIDLAVRQATDCATGVKTASWVEDAIAVSDQSSEALIISCLSSLEQGEPDETKDGADQRQELILSKIEELEFFVEISSLLRDELAKEIEKMTD